MMKETANKTNGKKFVEELRNGTFKKNYRPNHGPDFTGGWEGIYSNCFIEYVSSCSCYLMNHRMERRAYYG